MDNQSGSTEFITLEPANLSRIASLCGPLNEHIHKLEQHFGVQIHCRGNAFSIRGETHSRKMASCLIKQLYDKADKELTMNDIHLNLQQNSLSDLLNAADSNILIKTRKKTIEARGKHQIEYVRNMSDFDLNLAVGPAGTGKTYLAMAKAVEVLEQGGVDKLVLVRPAVEAGERLGFLPGDLAQKIDPYLKPMYDALYEIIGFDKVNRLVEQAVIEVTPLAYMRGRSLNNSFIILDEAQNTSIEQMKMFLTRIGFGSKSVIAGDITQIDLPKAQVSGFVHALPLLEDIQGIAITYFNSKDVIRHPLVSKIVEAYEQHHPDA